MFNRLPKYSLEAKQWPLAFDKFAIKAINNFTLTKIADSSKIPRLDILLTVSTHLPFLVPNQNYFIQKVKNRIELLKLTKDVNELDNANLMPLSSIMYFDESKDVINLDDTISAKVIIFLCAAINISLIFFLENIRDSINLVF